MHRKLGQLVIVLSVIFVLSASFGVAFAASTGGEAEVTNEAPNAPSGPHPGDGETVSETTSVTLQVTVSDPNGDTMDVTFYDDSDDSQIGSTQTGVSDGGTASVDWSSLTAGNDYSWYAVADDGSATTQSSTWSFHINESPTADFSYSPTDPLTNEQVSFTDESSDPDGTVDNWLWDLGDGTYKWVQNPDHTYTSSGTYTVELKAVENFYDSFEDGDISEWSGSTGALEVQTGTVYEGNYSLHTTSTGDIYNEFTSDPNPKPHYASFAFRTGTTNQNNEMLFALSEGVTNGPCIELWDNELRSCPAETTIRTLSADTWYDIEIKNVDYSNYTYDVVVDGTVEATDLAFQNETSYHDRVTVDNPSDTNYWDSIQVGESSTTTQDVTVTNDSPEVLGTDVSVNTADPESYFDVNTEIRDNNTLTEIDNVTVELYENTSSQGGADSVDEHYTFWFDPSDNTWHSSPSTNTQGDPYIDTSGSSYPSDLSVTSDNYNFKVLLNGTADHANDWNVYVEATDTESTSGSSTLTNDFSVSTYSTYNVSTDGTINFSTLSQDTTNNASDDNPITVDSVEANVSWDLQNRLENADWKNSGDTIGADNTKFNSTDESGTATSMTTSFQDVVSGQSEGEGLSQDIYYWIDIPSEIEAGTYTNNFIIEVVEN